MPRFRKQKIPTDIGPPAVHLALRAAQPKRSTFMQKPPSRNPLFSILEVWTPLFFTFFGGSCLLIRGVGVVEIGFS